MQQYEKYKDSGMDWIGEIPEHWEIRRIKTLFKEINERSFDGLEDLLSVSQYTGVTRKNDKIEEGDLLTNASTLEGYKIVRKGDLVSNIMLAWNGSLGFSPYNGITSPAYSIYRLKDSGEKQFFHYLFRTEKYKAEFKRQSSGVIESRLRLYSDDFFGIFSIVPPSEEQQTIAIFLDDKTSKIDQTIAIKEKEIELLKERRQIIIQKAVTKGLDDTVKLKDSGVDWIGEIPEHWEVRKLKYFIQNLEGGVSVNASESESAEVGDFGVLKTSCVYNYYFDGRENKKVFENEKSRVSCQVRKGSIIISRMNAPELVGASGLVFEDYPNLFLPDRLWQTVYRKNISFDPIWLSKILINKGFRNFMTTFANGSSPSMKNISKGDFLNIAIPFSPISEQKEIITYLQEIEKKIEKAILLKQQEIEKLKEYKMVLIDQVVTGKVRVQ
ncbi:restriction endonuclease subunit S [Chryseobacterium cucumeris]|uniref:restriction endonuclease subunit S n=1 Tax=Chryseobacterium cucumeris TaxID=1813611 RepID=UPI0032085BDD